MSEQLKTTDVHLPFPSISNCRDLAGIANKNGQVVAPGLLLRSASLHYANDHDLRTLQMMDVQTIVDLRTQWEIDADPDKLPDNSTLHHLPILHESTLASITGGSLQLAFLAVKDGYAVMEGFYREMIESEHSQSMWKEFFKILLETDQPLLWHCTQGKDRTGMAAALILFALDVDEQTILDEYLQTNLYMQSDREKMDHLAESIPGVKASSLQAFAQANPRYFNAAKEAVISGWGSWDGFLRQGLGLSEENIQTLKNKYLMH